MVLESNKDIEPPARCGRFLLPALFADGGFIKENAGHFRGVFGLQ